jgi:hypothetical protein
MRPKDLRKSEARPSVHVRLRSRSLVSPGLEGREAAPATAHDGEITVESADGAGSVFSVRLPAST